MNVITGRHKCLTCERYANPKDMHGGLCPVCLIQRSEFWKQPFLESIEDKYHCGECHAFLGNQGGFMRWDKLAAAFVVVCFGCREKAVAKAAEYRGTPFGYAHKAY